MTRRTRRALLFLLGLIAACEGDVQRPPTPAMINVQLRLQTAASPASFDALHLRLRDPASGAVLTDTLLAVDGSQSEWAIRLSTVMPRRTPVVDVVVEAELLSGTVRVEYSGRADAEIAAGTENVATVDLHRGPLDNLSVTSLGIRADTSAAMEGDSLRLHADLAGATAGSRVYWHSLQSDIATVDSTGLVSAHLPGTASIVATAGRAADTLDILVLPRPAGLVLSRDSIFLTRLSVVHYLYGSVTDSRGDTIMTVGGPCPAPCAQPVRFSSDDTTIARPFHGGVFVSVGEGRTMVRAAWPEYELYAEAPFIVQLPPQVPALISVHVRNRYLYALGDTDFLGAYIYDADGRSMEPQPVVTWESSNDSIATIHADPASPNTGVITAVSNGTALVRARLGDLVSFWVGVVVMQLVGSVEVTPAEAQLAVGASIRLTAFARDGRSHPMPHATFGWTSSDEAVATVAADGTVTAHRAGTAVITAVGYAAGTPFTNRTDSATVHVH